MTADRPASPRIFHVEYTTPPRRERGRFLPRRAATFVKVPYSGLYGLTETLTRAVSTGQIESFRVRAARPKEITNEVRASLSRWPEALETTSEVTAVEWQR